MATISKVSTKYKDIISKSSLIRPGSPALYRLRPKEEQFGTLTRKTVGEKNLGKVNKTILLVGETGTGKSTLINALFNYAVGVKFEENIWFEIVEDEKRSQCESQTSDVVVYEIFGFEGQTLPFSLTIIDTPGFGDTRGNEKVDISQRLFDLFRAEDGVNNINLVGLVVKMSDIRLSDQLWYIFNSVMSLFGNDMEKNIVALITHSDGRKPKNALKALDAAEIQCARDQKNQPVYFLFDNCQHEDRAEDREDLEQADKVSMRGISQFKDFLEKTEPQKLKKTVEVLNEHVRLKACVQNLQERVEFIELKQTEIRWMKEVLKKHEDNMKENEKFTVKVDEVYKEKERIKGGMWGFLWLLYKGAVTCKQCKENCHYPCTMAWKPSHCEVMRGGRCTSCTNKCPATDHVKEQWIYVTKTRKVKKTLQDMKDKYEENKAESEKKSSLLENLEEEMKKLTANKDQCLEESYHHLIRLDQIALNVDSLSTHVHLDFLIEKMKKKGDAEKVEKLKEMKGRVDERSRRGIEYAHNRKDTK